MRIPDRSMSKYVCCSIRRVEEKPCQAKRPKPGTQLCRPEFRRNLSDGSLIGFRQIPIGLPDHVEEPWEALSHCGWT